MPSGLSRRRFLGAAGLLAARPGAFFLPEFLGRKTLHDPDGRFQSDWYRHYRDMFGTGA